MRLNANLAVDIKSERIVRRANLLAQRRGFRSIRFGSTADGPSPHVTLSRFWIADPEELSSLVDSWGNTARELVARLGSRVSLNIATPRLHTVRGPYLLAAVRQSDPRSRELLQEFGRIPGGGLHMTIGASQRRAAVEPAPLFAPFRAHVRSVRLSIQGSHGTCLAAVDEVLLAGRLPDAGSAEFTEAGRASGISRGWHRSGSTAAVQ